MPPEFRSGSFVMRSPHLEVTYRQQRRKTPWHAKCLFHWRNSIHRGTLKRCATATSRSTEAAKEILRCRGGFVRSRLNYGQFFQGSRMIKSLSHCAIRAWASHIPWGTVTIIIFLGKIYEFWNVVNFVWRLFDRVKHLEWSRLLKAKDSKCWLG